MSTPFFSIVIPTKNRPHLLSDAIRSVLWQDFEDFELIVSDNFNDERTKLVVDEFKADSRLKYIRTDKELNMPDHWEFATRHAKGKYILILADRSLLINHALKELHQVIKQYDKNISIYSWQHIIYEKDIKLARIQFHNTAEIKIVPSHQLLYEYAHTFRGDYRYPMGVNSCYKKEVGDLIRTKHGRLFWPVNPDVTSCFLLLHYVENVACLGKPFYIGQGVVESNGRMVNKYGPYTYYDTIGRSYLYNYVPIKAPIVENVTINDFLAISNMANKDFYSKLDWAEYFLRCYIDVIYRAQLGDWWRGHKNELLKEWKRALNNADKAIQRRVKNKLLKTKIIYTIKGFLVKSSWLPILLKIQNKLAYKYRATHFNSALEAAGFKL